RGLAGYGEVLLDPVGSRLAEHDGRLGSGLVAGSRRRRVREDEASVVGGVGEVDGPDGEGGGGEHRGDVECSACDRDGAGSVVGPQGGGGAAFGGWVFPVAGGGVVGGEASGEEGDGDHGDGHGAEEEAGEGSS